MVIARRVAATAVPLAKWCARLIPRRWPSPPMVSLGLRGGDSFGTFSWGFLDRLRAEESLAVGAASRKPAPGQHCNRNWPLWRHGCCEHGGIEVMPLISRSGLNPCNLLRLRI